MTKIRTYIYPVLIAFCFFYAALILVQISRYAADPPYLLTWFVKLWWATTGTQVLLLLVSSLFLMALGVGVIRFGLWATDFIFTQPDKYRLRSLSVTLLFGIIGIYATSYGLVGFIRVFWCISTLL